MQTLKLEFIIPNPELAEITQNLPQQELKELAIAAFYSKGHLTLKEAAQLLSVSDRVFLEILQRLQIPFGGDFDTEEAAFEATLLKQKHISA